MAQLHRTLLFVCQTDHPTSESRTDPSTYRREPTPDPGGVKESPPARPPATSPAQYLAPSRPSKQAKNASPRPKQGGGCCSRVKARASAFSRKAEAATHASLGVLLGGQQRGGANDEVCGNLGGTGSRGRLLRPCSDRGVGRDSVGRHHSRQAHQHAVGALVRLRVQPASKQVRQSPQRWGLQAERSEPPPTDGCEGRL